MESSKFPYMHVYIRKANLTTKRRFEIVDLPRFAWMNSHGSRAQKSLYTQKACKCEEFCFQKRLGGEICSPDEIMQKSHCESLIYLKAKWLKKICEIMYICDFWPSACFKIYPEVGELCYFHCNFCQLLLHSENSYLLSITQISFEFQTLSWLCNILDFIGFGVIQ